MLDSLRKYTYYLFSIFELLFGVDSPILVVKIFLKLAQPGVKTIRLRRCGLRIRVRGAMDVWSIKETFLDRFYEKFGFLIQPSWKIIDVGAGMGDYTLYAAMAQPSGHVFAFEPFPESFILMQENLQLNGITNVQAFDEAIGAETGELLLDLTGGEPLQFQSHHKIVEVEKSLYVKSLSLLDALTKLGLESCDLLKMDCEGAEYSILFTTPLSVLERIQRIVMEYHDNVTQYNHIAVVSLISNHGLANSRLPSLV